MVQQVQATAFEFGPYRLLPLQRLLLRDGQTVPLTPKVFETLLVFVRNRGRLLSKDDLMKLIWPESVVEEGNLTQNIFLLRKILGENPHDHQYLVTVPLQGYCFVADVKETNGNGLYSNADAAQTLTQIPQTIFAVLPFTALNPAAGHEFEGLGITDTLITKLSGLKQLVVRPTSAVLRYGEAKNDLVAVGRELQVGSILDGTVQHTDARVRVNVRLLDVNTGDTLWTATYDENQADIFSVQDSIADQVAQALQIKLSGAERQLLSKYHPDDIDAYTLYIKGRYFWDTRTEQGLLKGISYAREALALDPNNALAHVGIADSHCLLAEYLYEAPEPAFTKARAAALTALELDPSLAEAYASLGEIQFFYDWNWSEAEINYKKAMAMKPNYASVRLWYTWWLMATGRLDGALENIMDSQSIDPGCLTLNTVIGLPFYYKRQFERAAKQFQSTLEMQPRFAQARYYLGATYLQLGRYQEAAAQFEKLIPNEYSQQSTALLAFTLAMAGQPDKAKVLLNELKIMARKRYVSPYLEAIVLTGLGERERALTQLEKAFREHACWMVFLNIDPLFDTLRNERRFESLIRRMAFPGVDYSD